VFDNANSERINEDAVDALRRQFGKVSPDTVRRIYYETLNELLAEARIVRFVHIFARRQAKLRLAEIAVHKEPDP